MPQDVLDKPQKVEKNSAPQKTSIITASYLPKKIVTNEDIIAMGLDTTSTALKRSLGVLRRRAAAPNETGADMMAKVARQILERAKLSPQDIDMIICSCDPAGDAAVPNTASFVQGKIGATCPAFDVSMSCTGWVAGIEIALNYLRSGKSKILILASSLIGTRILFRDLNNKALFGDGAGGILLQSHNIEHILSIGLWTTGQYYSKIYVPYSWSILPEDIPFEYKNSFYMYNNQRFFFDVMDNSSFIPFAMSILDKAGIDINDIDLFLLHYPSKPLFERFLKNTKIPREKIFHQYEEYGNLVAAEMPVNIDCAINSGRIKNGDIIFCFTYGAGFTAGGFVMRY